MVQEEISQLTGECSTWRENLRYLREEFTQDENKLRQVAAQPLSKEQLLEVEHLHNQFHIQLINIHDLKQAIKNHERKMNFEIELNKETLDNGLISEHENILEQYQRLDDILQNLRQEFADFVDRTR